MANSQILNWFIATRPKTLVASIAPVVIGAAMAGADGFMNVPILVCIFISAIFIQIGTNLSNDYYDYKKGADNADSKGPRRCLLNGMVTSRQMKIAFIAAFAIAALFGLVLVIYGGVPILIIGVISLISGLAYTAGPYPLAYLGLGDIFVLIFFGPIPVAGTYYLMSGSVNESVILAGFAPGLLSVCILTVNNIRDIETDRLAYKKTLAVRFGRLFGIAEYIACIVLVGAISIYLCFSGGQRYFVLICLIALVYAAFIVRGLCANPCPEKANLLLESTGKLLLMYTILFSSGWIISA